MKAVSWTSYLILVNGKIEYMHVGDIKICHINEDKVYNDDHRCLRKNKTVEKSKDSYERNLTKGKYKENENNVITPREKTLVPCASPSIKI